MKALLILAVLLLFAKTTIARTITVRRSNRVYSPMRIVDGNDSTERHDPRAAPEQPLEQGRPLYLIAIPEKIPEAWLPAFHFVRASQPQPRTAARDVVCGRE